MRFANAMRTAQNLPEDMIPSLEPESIPKPKASLPATSRSSARRPPPVTDGDGAEMADEGRLLRGGASRSGDNGPTSAAEPQRENSDLVKVGSKRKVQESLSQAQASSKRVRVTRKTAAIEGGKDLSEHTFPEDSEVSAELVPQVEGKVSIFVVRADFANRSLGLQPLPPEKLSMPAHLAQEQVVYHRPLCAMHDLKTGVQLQGCELGDRGVAYIDCHESRARTPREGSSREAEGDVV